MNIAVIFGGESCEHDISIITGEQLITKVNGCLHNVIPIYINKDGVWLTGDSLNDIDNFPNDLGKTYECTFVPKDNWLYIKKGKRLKKYIEIDVAFVCLHGLRGEDGCVAGVLELSKIPYSSSSICSSAVCMDKVVFKYFAKGLGVNVVDGIDVSEDDYIINGDVVKGVVRKLGYPVIIKPSRQGSSIGIEVCENENDLDDTLNRVFMYDKSVLVEKFLTIEKEVNVAMFENKGEYIISNTEEPITNEKFLNFDDKYRNNSGGFETIKRILPAKVSDEQYRNIIDSATICYKTLKMFGVVRFDFIIANGGEVYLNEINTIPGSMANYLFDNQKYPYSKLIEILISNAVFRKEKSSEVIKVFDSDVLNNGFSGFKK